VTSYRVRGGETHITDISNYSQLNGLKWFVSIINFQYI